LSLRTVPYIGKIMGGKKIKDQYSNLPISRQRKYQLRMQQKKRCTICGAPAEQGTRCLKHMVEIRERIRKTLGLKRRYKNSLSYKLEEGS
jgi:hypothetical protein